MRKIAFVFVSLLLPLLAAAQNVKDTTQVAPPTTISPEDNYEIFVVIDEDASFPGGEKARIKFISENLKYPIDARKKNIEGTVYIAFVIEKDGSISNAKILRDIGGGLGEEALRVVKMMPKWIPGKNKGEPVQVKFSMPVKFVLN